MRLGEIKKIVDESADTANQLTIEAETVYAGQAYKVLNYSGLMKALEVLHGQSWNDIDYAPIMQIRKAHAVTYYSVTLTVAEYNELNQYVSSLNTKLPIFLGILEGLVEEQDSQLINIKLPKELTSFTNLNKLNSQLEKLFKEFTVDGDVQFRGFDKGSDWYMVQITGVMTYAILLGCLKIAQEFFKTKTEYYNSKKAELDYRASPGVSDDFTQKDVDDYITRRLDLELEKDVKEVLEKIHATNGHTVPELQSKILIATKDLVKQLGDGVEFHLSLNPPEYANEKAGSLIIDYEKIQNIVDKEKAEHKTITDGSTLDLEKDTSKPDSPSKGK